jgi:hypothetical protein
MALNDGVHNTHCCKIHGCKYNDPDCPVEFGDLMGVYCDECVESAKGVLLSHSTNPFPSTTDCNLDIQIQEPCYPVASCTPYRFTLTASNPDIYCQCNKCGGKWTIRDACITIIHCIFCGSEFVNSYSIVHVY